MIQRRKEARPKALWTKSFGRVRMKAKADKTKKIRKPIRRRSRKTESLMAEYRRRREVFLAHSENKFCAVFKNKIATEIHHKFGRISKLLLYERFWIPVSRMGHEWIHANPEKAREQGLLCERGQWNKSP